jgi:hypothetical protein
MEVLGCMKWDDESSSSAFELESLIGLASNCRDEVVNPRLGNLLYPTPMHFSQH